MNDKELADKMVASGLARKEGKQYYYLKGNPETHDTAERFVRDWRVTGAMMERAQSDGFTIGEIGCWVNDYAIDRHDWPRAINEACVEALE